MVRALFDRLSMTNVTHSLQYGVYSKDVEDHLGFIEHVPLKNYTVELGKLKKGKVE